MQARTDEWSAKTLGWVEDVGDLGAIWERGDDKNGGGADGSSGCGCTGSEAASSLPSVPLTWMNNISTGEGPDGIKQYEVDAASRTMSVKRAADGKLLVTDRLGSRDVQVCCAHFSGGAKRFLEPRWLVQHFGCDPGLFADAKAGLDHAIPQIC